jgi:hypothetical protein
MLLQLLRETPGVLAENRLGIQADTLSNKNFFPGLAALRNLLPSLQAKMVVANVLTGLPNVVASSVITTPAGTRVGFVGALTPADAAALDPAILQNVTIDLQGWMARLVDARNALASSALPPHYIVGLLNQRDLQTPAGMYPCKKIIGGKREDVDMICRLLDSITLCAPFSGFDLGKLVHCHH